MKNSYYKVGRDIINHHTLAPIIPVSDISIPEIQIYFDVVYQCRLYSKD